MTVMLSEAIRLYREEKQGEGRRLGEIELLRAFELDARNMEERLLLSTGQPHLPLGGNFITKPEIECGHAEQG